MADVLTWPPEKPTARYASSSSEAKALAKIMDRMDANHANHVNRLPRWHDVSAAGEAQQGMRELTLEMMSQLRGAAPQQFSQQMQDVRQMSNVSPHPPGVGRKDPYEELAQRITIQHVESDEGLNGFLDQLTASGDRVIELDFETTGYQPYTGTPRLVQIGFSDAEGRMQVGVIDMFDINDHSRLAALLADESIQKRIHNARFERDWSYFHFGVEIKNVMDTMVAFKTVAAEVKKIEDPEERERVFPGWADYEQAEQQRAEELRAQGRRVPSLSNLAHACQATMGAVVPKEEQASDWSEEELTSSQLTYAAMDVALMNPLGDRLEAALDQLDPSVREKMQSQIDGQHQSIADTWSFDTEEGVLHRLATPKHPVTGKAVRGAEKVERRVLDRSAGIAWSILDAQDGEALNKVRALSRRSCLAWSTRAMLEKFFAQREAELQAQAA